MIIVLVQYSYEVCNKNQTGFSWSENDHNYHKCENLPKISSYFIIIMFYFSL